MALLNRLSNRLVNATTDRVDSWGRSIAAQIPTNAGENEMRRRHADWARTAELHRTYWTADSKYYWVSVGGNGGGDQLIATNAYVFVRRDTTGLVTKAGAHSWDLFFQAGLKGFTTVEPPKPPKGEEFFVRGDLRDLPADWVITR
ncbi:hypothetical protein OG689_10900 [Kitasatospora sp. NBC_00240]|uniref:hypothetical protein n=1 Tax=Kitasatospora sp. NBC_00240 TaxID=2903567 RepID=UPI00225C2B7E|nr:hypothetical protein [Kitasatospora sp. NBC_00240]MCX5209792.1 hypothetical protein [Kitasatospora sp. NBC_00240]